MTELKSPNEYEFILWPGDLRPGTLFLFYGELALVMSQWKGECQVGTWSKEACETMVPDEKLFLASESGATIWSCTWDGSFTTKNTEMLVIV